MLLSFQKDRLAQPMSWGPRDVRAPVWVCVLGFQLGGTESPAQRAEPRRMCIISVWGGGLWGSQAGSAYLEGFLLPYNPGALSVAMRVLLNDFVAQLGKCFHPGEDGGDLLVSSYPGGSLSAPCHYDPEVPGLSPSSAGAGEGLRGVREVSVSLGVRPG